MACECEHCLPRTKDWERTVSAFRDAHGLAPLVPGEMEELQASWHAAVERARELEAELPVLEPPPPEWLATWTRGDGENDGGEGDAR